MKHYVSSGAKCPFYTCEESTRIMCEGIQTNSTVHIVFGMVNQRQKYSREYCQGDYKRCIQYQGLMRKYDDTSKD